MNCAQSERLGRVRRGHAQSAATGHGIQRDREDSGRIRPAPSTRESCRASTIIGFLSVDCPDFGQISDACRIPAETRTNTREKRVCRQRSAALSRVWSRAGSRWISLCPAGYRGGWRRNGKADRSLGLKGCRFSTSEPWHTRAATERAPDPTAVAARPTARARVHEPQGTAARGLGVHRPSQSLPPPVPAPRRP